MGTRRGWPVRNLVESPRVRAQVEALRPDKPVRSILSRGNYPKRTFLVVYEDQTAEILTLPPERPQ
jgi:hypothetical protein